MSIYKQMMGEEFNRLHPMVQKRYEFIEGRPFTGKGIMTNIKSGPKWMYPVFWLGTHWKLLFPENGKDVPFTIVNKPGTGQNGETQVHWERIFYFKKEKRYFNALMSYDRKRNIIRDYLGEPYRLYSDLIFSAARDGTLIIQSNKQRLVLGRLEIPLPAILQGKARIEESFLDRKNAYHIHVEVTNPVIGTVFAYEGEFSSDDIS
ncbi:DUF4166 domain-containing protein [Sediminibacillus massiliensis]|uniref:DUF4166 domain-containing protein n=1 Tax=Sediminibacillus massiliensis TaxID=1926277 RepID=UPI000988381D|nr:DUF4166 domain-containing protein [Sediminibacillus massiliensis]